MASPFSQRKSLVWDCTCVDTFAETHLAKAAIGKALQRYLVSPLESLKLVYEIGIPFPDSEGGFYTGLYHYYVAALSDATGPTVDWLMGLGAAT